MNILIEISTVFIEIFLTWFFFYKMNLKPQKGGHTLAHLCFYIFYGIILFFTSLFLEIPFRILTLCLYIFLGNKFLFHHPKAKVLYLVILFFTASALSDVVCGTILTITGLPLKNIIASTTGYIIYLTFAKLTHLLLLVIIATATKMRHNPSAILSALPLIFCHCISLIVLDLHFHYLLDNGDIIKITSSTLCLFIINIIICCYVEFLNNSHIEREKRSIAEHQLKMQEIYYSNLIQSQEETRSLWHDIKKYMLAMENLVASNKQDKAVSESLKLKDKLRRIEFLVDTGNPIIDGILNYSAEQAKMHNIDIDFDVWIPPELPFSSSDLYVIIGNTVDNAITACTHVTPNTKRNIHLTLRQNNHILLYEIENPYNTSIATPRNHLHGYGLENVKTCVEQNNGHMIIKKNSGIFQVSIQLSK